MKKENLIILLAIAAVAVAWTYTKKRYAGPLILELDKGSFGPKADIPDNATKTLFDI